MTNPPRGIEEVADECLAMYRAQLREETEWNEPPSELADIIYALSETHRVDQRLLTERVRARLRRPAGGAAEA